jgi:hypothetical protein
MLKTLPYAPTYRFIIFADLEVVLLKQEIATPHDIVEAVREPPQRLDDF